MSLAVGSVLWILVSRKRDIDMVAVRTIEVLSLFRVRKISVAGEDTDELPKWGFSEEISHDEGPRFREVQRNNVCQEKARHPDRSTKGFLASSGSSPL